MKKIGLIALIVLLISTLVMNISSGESTAEISVKPQETLVGKPKNFTIDINVTNSEPTWAWNFNITWDPSLLNLTDIREGLFLNKSGSTFMANNTNYDRGWTYVGCTLLQKNETHPIPPNGNGTLATLNFTVLENQTRSCPLNLYNTTLLWENLTAYTHTIQNGTFYLLMGDVNTDGKVDIFDIGSVSAHWYPGPPIGPLGYDPVADLNNNGTVNIFDIGIVSANWGNTM